MSIVACGSDASIDATDEISLVSNPSIAETSVLRQVLSEPGMDRMCIDPVTASPERPQNWVDTLFFGGGQVSRKGNPRYDEAIERYDVAVSVRPYRLRLPGMAAHGGAGLTPCDRRLTLYPPYFDRDMAFVVANERHARGEVPGGEFHLWIFRNRDNRWSPIGYGQGTYGRPVI